MFTLPVTPKREKRLRRRKIEYLWIIFVNKEGKIQKKSNETSSSPQYTWLCNALFPGGGLKHPCIPNAADVDSMLSLCCLNAFQGNNSEINSVSVTGHSSFCTASCPDLVHILIQINKFCTSNLLFQRAATYLCNVDLGWNRITYI